MVHIFTPRGEWRLKRHFSYGLQWKELVRRNVMMPLKTFAPEIIDTVIPEIFYSAK